MFTFILVIHIIVSVVLILVILLQDGKGGDLVSALGGGGSQTLFGSTGAAGFLTKATIALTIVFVLTSLGLAVLKTREQRSVIGEINPAVEKTQPVEVKTEEEKATTPGAADQTEPAVETPAPAPADSGVKADKTDAEVKKPEAKPADANKEDNGKK
ncbi:MAG: preprotein translocase subunit SecG [Holophagae bacterium]|nr:preprotein translocase subunit SecG [Holophagae bacterium]